jgi:hypothetical protein
MKHTRALLAIFLVLFTLFAIGCGGNTNTKTSPTTAQGLIDPSGNWKMNFVDSNSQNFILAGLFSQTGAVVSGDSFSEVGNVEANFHCVADSPSIALSNGLVANVSTFTGTLTDPNFGTLAFTSTLNDAGTHAGGTYTLTPTAAGNCLGIALTGTFTGDEVPSMSGSWTGTVTCTTDCPTQSPAGTTGTITANLTQDDSLGTVSGSYTITNMLPLFSTGTIATNSKASDFLSGASWQGSLIDSTGNTNKIDGGPFEVPPFASAGLGQDGSFNGLLIGEICSTGNCPVFTVTMHHQ